MRTESIFFCFRDGALEPVTEPDSEQIKLEAADSFLVEEGRVRHLARHLNRFKSSVERVCPTEVPALESFFKQVIDVLPREGRWFPRIEFHGNTATANHLHLRLREAPDALETIALWTLNEPDPRTNPEIKGPDLSLGQQLRRKANLHGADEAVLLNQDGFILEGALSSLVWWRDGELCAPGDDLPWLPSITREAVFEIARQTGVRIRSERVKPRQLNGLEIWALSALHGIRVVTDWADLPDGPANPERAEAFRKRLRMLATSL